MGSLFSKLGDCLFDFTLVDTRYERCQPLPTDPPSTWVYRHRHTSWYNGFVRTGIVDHQYLAHNDSICAERLVGETCRNMEYQWATVRRV